MKKVLKWVGIVIGGLLLLIVVAGTALSVSANSRLNKTYDIRAETIAIPTDPEAIARGSHIADVICRECHTADLTGEDILGDPSIGTLYAANITGLADTHSDEEIVRAIRHGLDTDGRQLDPEQMPWKSFSNFSDDELTGIWLYLQSLPASETES